jgi:hypothetical protein
MILRSRSLNKPPCIRVSHDVSRPCSSPSAFVTQVNGHHGMVKVAHREHAQRSELGNGDR